MYTLNNTSFKINIKVYLPCLLQISFHGYLLELWVFQLHRQKHSNHSDLQDIWTPWYELQIEEKKGTKLHLWIVCEKQQIMYPAFVGMCQQSNSSFSHQYPCLEREHRYLALQHELLLQFLAKTSKIIAMPNELWKSLELSLIWDNVVLFLPAS